MAMNGSSGTHRTSEGSRRWERGGSVEPALDSGVAAVQKLNIAGTSRADGRSRRGSVRWKPALAEVLDVGQLAITVPQAMAVLSEFGSLFPTEQDMPHDPPAKRIPLPGRIERHRPAGTPASTNDSSADGNMAACSPFLMMTNFGPGSRIFRPARTRLISSVSIRASPSLMNKPSTSFEQRVVHAAGFDPEVHRVGHDELPFLAWDRTLRCIAGLPLARKTNGVSAKVGEKIRVEGAEHVQVDFKGFRRAHVSGILPRPSEGGTILLDDQPRGVDLAAFKHFAMRGRKSSPTTPTSRTGVK